MGGIGQKDGLMCGWKYDSIHHLVLHNKEFV